MRNILSFFLILLAMNFSFGQKNDASEEPEVFKYLDLKEEFDLVVDVAVINPECATKKINYYSVIIGTTVIEDSIERISVLVPCLSNQYVQGDLITIKPLKAPKKDIVYLSQIQKRGEETIEIIFGADFRATWGNVVKVL